jgi:hypothetical protein
MLLPKNTSQLDLFAVRLSHSLASLTPGPANHARGALSEPMEAHCFWMKLARQTERDTTRAKLAFRARKHGLV